MAVAFIAPAASSAATFTVNQTGDQGDANVGNDACDWDTGTAGNQCTLRAAIDQANVGAASKDTIQFASGVIGDTISPFTSLVLTTPMEIKGGDCPGGGLSHKPCVRVDGTTSDAFQLTGGADGSLIKGLAITGASSVGILTGFDNDGFELRNSWLGLDLDQVVISNGTGVFLQGTNAVIGGTTGAERNVFAGNGTGLTIRDGDDNRVRGNYFGVKPDGATPAGNTTRNLRLSNDSDTATGNVIGASVSSAAQSTTTCDGGCNLIDNSSIGIEVTPGAADTTIKGNFIGLPKNGSDSGFGNSFRGIENAGIGTTIGGASSADRNFITGGANSVFSSGADARLERNFIGLNSAGTAPVAPGSFGAAIAYGTVTRNRFAVDSFGLDAPIDGPAAQEARVIRNKFGLRKDGGDLPDSTGTAIRVLGSGATIGEPDRGNTIGNLSRGIWIVGGDSNTVGSNYIGVDSAGTAHPNSEVGIFIESSGANGANDNTIGGTTGASENVISNSGDDAIRIPSGATPPTGNQIIRNRGKDNGSTANHLFIDLGTDGFTNGTGANGGIEAPFILDGIPGDTTRTHTEGSCASCTPGATIYIFRTSAPAGSSPNRINAFVDTATVDGSLNWSANFPQIPSGQRLTALALDPTDGSSELALAVAP